MNHVKIIKDMFESVSDYRKMVILMLSIKNDQDLLKEGGFLKNDNKSLNKEFNKILMEQNEENLNYFENEESTIEKILKN